MQANLQVEEQDNPIYSRDASLPTIISDTISSVESLTTAWGIPRDVLNSDDEIHAACRNLPRVLNTIPANLRNEGITRMCVAAAVGLFDSAINYIWNSSIIELRNKVRRFGLPVVTQIMDQEYDNEKLLDLKDSELLDLCLKLNLITEEGFFFLDQCRDIRNNFSAAHPPIGPLDDHEFISFVNRCAKYALGSNINPVGVDIQGFIQAVHGGKFTEDQKNTWTDRIRRTHQAQLELLIGTLQGIYCDPDASEEARINSLTITREFIDEFTPQIRSSLINRHADYQAKGDEVRYKASLDYFDTLGIISLLSDTERHRLVSKVCKQLMNVHQDFNNFYNEPPFAEHLERISGQGAIPLTAKNEFVNTVVTCAVGNAYGTSNAALWDYKKIIRNFSPKEVSIMLSYPKSNTIVGRRIRSHSRCREMFSHLVNLIDESTVSTHSKPIYERWKDRMS